MCNEKMIFLTFLPVQYLFFYDLVGFRPVMFFPRFQSILWAVKKTVKLCFIENILEKLFIQIEHRKQKTRPGDSFKTFSDRIERRTLPNMEEYKRMQSFFGNFDKCKKMKNFPLWKKHNIWQNMCKIAKVVQKDVADGSRWQVDG